MLFLIPFKLAFVFLLLPSLMRHRMRPDMFTRIPRHAASVQVARRHPELQVLFSQRHRRRISCFPSCHCIRVSRTEQTVEYTKSGAGFAYTQSFQHLPLYFYAFAFNFGGREIRSRIMSRCVRNMSTHVPKSTDRCDVPRTNRHLFFKSDGNKPNGKLVVAKCFRSWTHPSNAASLKIECCGHCPPCAAPEQPSTMRFRYRD